MAATGAAEAPARGLSAALGLGLATLGARAAGFAGGLVLAAQLGPAGLGSFSTLRALLAYGNLNHLGALEAYRRELPRLRAAGREDEARLVEGAAWRVALTGSLLLWLLVAAGAAAWAAAYPVGVLAGRAAAVQWLAATILPVTLGTFFGERLALRGGFGAVARLRLLRGLAYATLLPAGAALAGVAGAAAGLCASEWLLVGLARAAGGADGTRGARAAPPRSALRAAALRLVGAGLPVTLAWWIVLVQDSLDRVACASLLGAEATGLYALGALLASLVFLLPEALSRVLHPQLCAAAGRDDARRTIEARVDAVADTLALWLPPLLGAASFLVEPFLAAALPAYLPAAAPGRVLLLGAGIAALLPGGLDLLVATGRPLRLLAVGPAAVLARLAFCAAGARLGDGLVGLAAGSVAATIVFVALLEAAAHRPGATRRLARRLAPTIVVAGLATLLETLRPSGHGGALLAAAVCLPLSLAALLPLPGARASLAGVLRRLGHVAGPRPARA